MSKIVVADSDALIALTLENDPHNEKARMISKRLSKNDAMIIFPITVFPEAITTLTRAFNQPKKAHLVNEQLKQGVFQVEYINPEIIELATELFANTISKQNTFFDAIVASTAKKLGAQEVFSFDEWYTKLGFKLVGI